MNSQNKKFTSKNLFALAAVFVFAVAFNISAQSESFFFTKVSSPAAVFTVTNTNDSGTGSLRQAITNANNSTGADEISFNIAPDDGTVKTITLTSSLPIITGAVTISGYTQPQTSPNTLAVGSNAVLLIEIVGAGSSGNSAFDGLTVTAGNSTIRGLVLRNFVSAISLLNNGGNRIEGNRIGTNAAGTTGSSNSVGVDIQSGSANQIGGVSPDQRNLLSSNTGNAIRIISGANNNIIENNYVGTNASGTAALGNGSAFFLNAGIDIRSASNRVGGTAAGAGNLISGNPNYGMYINGGSDTLVQGNRIGTNASGNGSVANLDGIEINNGSNTVIGGTDPAAGNVISGNGRDGIAAQVIFNGVTTATIQSNYIGVAADGITPLSNSGSGIRARLVRSVIGAVTSGGAGGNIIANNGGAGVALVTDPFNPTLYFGCRVLSNKIYNNNGIGIDLSRNENPDGVTQNDTGDADQGGNNLQNFPVITTVTVNGGSTRIQGNINSSGNTQFVLEFFASQVASVANAEGQTLLGSRTLTTNASGNLTFDETFPVNTAGQSITATATNLTTFDTSEFTGTALMPTASGVTVSGKVTNVAGKGISNALVTLIISDGDTRSVITNRAGYFLFYDVPAGQTCIITVKDKRNTFGEPTKIVSVFDNITDINFTALPRWKIVEDEKTFSTDEVYKF